MGESDQSSNPENRVELNAAQKYFVMVPRQATFVKRDRKTRVLSLIWALLPVVSFGLATPFVILFAGRRLGSHVLKWSALCWGVAFIVGFVMVGNNGKAGAFNGAADLIFFLVIIGGTFHAFALRPAVFRLDTLDVDRSARRSAERIVREHPLEAVRLRIGRVDIDEQERMSDGGLIDVNNSEITALGLILGLDSAQKAALAEIRSASGGFTSPAEFEVKMGLDPYLLEPVAGRLVSLPLMGSSAAHLSGSTSAVTRARADGRNSGRPVRTAPFGVHFASYVWALSPAATGGLAAPPAMAFAAARLKSSRLWLTSAIYLAAIISLAFSAGLTNSNIWDTIALWVVGGTATIHAFLLRKDVFEVDVVRSDRIKRQEALRLASRDPQEAIRLQIGRVDIPEADRYPDGGLIDMNNVPASAMCAATGIESKVAQQIVTVRSLLWGFSNLPDLCNQLGIAPQIFDAVGSRLVFLPLLSAKGPEDPASGPVPTPK